MAWLLSVLLAASLLLNTFLLLGRRRAAAVVSHSLHSSSSSSAPHASSQPQRRLMQRNSSCGMVASGHGGSNKFARCMDRLDQAAEAGKCSSYFECSLTPPLRATIGMEQELSKIFTNALRTFWNPATGAYQQSHMPVCRKPGQLNASAAPTDARKPPSRDLNMALSSPQERLAWPGRGNTSEMKWIWQHMPPDGLNGQNCGRGRSLWYCSHFSAPYYHNWESWFEKGYMHTGIFSRPDVRLVLDIAGSSGNFAHAANKAVGDGKLITITGNMYSMQDHHLHMPFNEYISARGYPSVLIDMYSYFPFSDNTFDLVHSSWAYHDGFPRATLHEITRVLRPGGWLVLRSMNDWTLNEVIQFATDYAWPFCAKNSQLGVPRSHVNGEVLWCQAPTYHGSSSATATA